MKDWQVLQPIHKTQHRLCMCILHLLLYVHDTSVCLSFLWVISINQLARVSNLRRAVSGEKQNSFGNLEILPGIGRLKIFSSRHEVIKLNFREVWVIWKGGGGAVFQSFRTIFPDFREDFYFHMVLLKQHLLKVSRPVTRVISRILFTVLWLARCYSLSINSVV